MSPRAKVIFTAVIVGIIIATCLVAPFATMHWFNTNPSISELQENVIDEMTLSEDEYDRLYNMMVAGAFIDFGINLILFLFPAVIVGSLLGFVGGHLWHKQTFKEGSVL